MRQKLKVIDKSTGKSTQGEIVYRDLDHLEAQKKYRANVFKKKKGKGSFKRKKTFSKEDL